MGERAIRNWVNEWKQEGAIYIWCYAKPGRSREGWHFSGDPVGCRSIRNLLDRMRGGDACYRTLKLGPVTKKIWEVPNFGIPRKDNFASLRIEFQPDFDDLNMFVERDRLKLMLGNKRVKTLGAAFAAVETGDGDFGIATSDRKRSETWMFWWV